MNNSLLLLHGYPFERTLWRPVQRHLGPHICSWAVDLPGFGNVPVSAAQPSMTVMAEAVIQAIQQAGVRRTVVAGFSMGGYVALALAEMRPDLLSGLALINSQAAADSEETRQARRETIAKVRQEGPGVAVKAAGPKMFSTPTGGPLDGFQVVEDGAAQAGVNGICWALEAMARRPDRTEVLKRLQIPAVVVHSDKDQFIPITRAVAAFESLRNGRFVLIPNAGHATPLEAPQQVAGALEDLVRAAF